jgi:hypothetical protein
MENTGQMTSINTSIPDKKGLVGASGVIQLNQTSITTFAQHKQTSEKPEKSKNLETSEKQNHSYGNLSTTRNTIDLSFKSSKTSLSQSSITNLYVLNMLPKLTHHTNHVALHPQWLYPQRRPH